jgi:serine/threonine-protein phosphatase 2A activator
MAENQPRGFLETLDSSKPHKFEIPAKRINEGEDVNFWLTSWAYTDLMTFLLQLNASMFPTKRDDETIQAWTLEKPLQYSGTILRLRTLIQELDRMLDDAPPDPGPRRFGNVSFRTWYGLVEERVDELLEMALPSEVLMFGASDGKDVTAKQELKAYLLGSFGSAQRLDYGTGHELSYLAFLGGIWKLGGFGEAQSSEKGFGTRERQIVLGVIEPYVFSFKLYTTRSIY